MRDQLCYEKTILIPKLENIMVPSVFMDVDVPMFGCGM